jgi:LacI family transcriptional regulator
MTVSRVINNSGYISPKTRERVERAVAELGYVPNALARSLHFKQTNTIALILTDITNPFFTTIARGVEDTASRYGFSVLFCNTDESPAEEAQYMNMLLQKQVDGVLLVPAGSTADSVVLLQERKIPVVVLDRRINGVPVDTVLCDSVHGAFQLTEYLLGLGHTRIAVLTGPEEISTASDRVAGYRTALTAAGMGTVDERIYYGQFSEEDGYRMACEALQMLPRPTALFAGNNFIAVGAYRALHESGLAVPRDVSLVAFDDLPRAFVLDPFLTVVGQSAYLMGQTATELLLKRLAGEPAQASEEIILPTEMIIRRSTGPAPAGS